MDHTFGHSGGQPVETVDALYDAMGGMETCRRLATAFYRRIDTDPRLRSMFATDLQDSIEYLALFLAQRFGGPTTYSEQRGHPRLRMRHRHFRIGAAERDAWVGHMLAAMDEVGIAEPARSLMRRYFEDSAAFLVNAHDDSAGPSELQLRSS